MVNIPIFYIAPIIRRYFCPVCEKYCLHELLDKYHIKFDGNKRVIDFTCAYCGHVRRKHYATVV